VLVAVEREHALPDDLTRREPWIVDRERVCVAHHLEREVATCHQPAVQSREPRDGLVCPQLSEHRVWIGLQVGQRDGSADGKLHPADASRYPRVMPTQQEVVEALREVEDPELGMDIVELGLFYDAEIEGAKVKVHYTLTSMGCPAGAMIQEDIERVLRQIPGVEDVESELTFDPPWTPDKMSDDAKFILGFG